MLPQWHERKPERHRPRRNHRQLRIEHREPPIVVHQDFVEDPQCSSGLIWSIVAAVVLLGVFITIALIAISRGRANASDTQTLLKKRGGPGPASNKPGSTPNKPGSTPNKSGSTPNQAVVKPDSGNWRERAKFAFLTLTGFLGVYYAYTNGWFSFCFGQPLVQFPDPQYPKLRGRVRGENDYFLEKLIIKPCPEGGYKNNSTGQCEPWYEEPVAGRCSDGRELKPVAICEIDKDTGNHKNLCGVLNKLERKMGAWAQLKDEKGAWPRMPLGHKTITMSVDLEDTTKLGISRKELTSKFLTMAKEAAGVIGMDVELVPESRGPNIRVGSKQLKPTIAGTSYLISTFSGPEESGLHTSQIFMDLDKFKNQQSWYSWLFGENIKDITNTETIERLFQHEFVHTLGVQGHTKTSWRGNLTSIMYPSSDGALGSLPEFDKQVLRAVYGVTGGCVLKQR